jgi:L-ascorbate metabolism protein UlaG (beta-lactamase superfamily)
MLLPCNHWTMRNPLVGPDRSLWGAYLIRTAAGANILISGDTAYFEQFKEIGSLFNIDIAIFNLGAYAPRWIMRESHMNPEETVQAFQDSGAQKMLILHWGTFRLGDEPVHLPPLDLKGVLKRENLLDRLIDITHGQTLYL